MRVRAKGRDRGRIEGHLDICDESCAQYHIGEHIMVAGEPS